MLFTEIVKLCNQSEKAVYTSVKDQDCQYCKIKSQTHQTLQSMIELELDIKVLTLKIIFNDHVQIIYTAML